mmetsp:Transcript_5876/g.4448  ORF Transcript_5876/g.4448 Transcript_5876/m.4448 type:complete len:95 (+) Transcript_5876:111-395(+)
MHNRGLEEVKQEEKMKEEKEEDEDFDLYMFPGKERFEVNDYMQVLCNGEEDLSDFDEEDSNREDHENNEYPDEDEEEGGGYREDYGDEDCYKMR